VYNVEVTAAGFQTVIREKIVLRVADKVNLPLELKVGQTTESIVVTAEQEVIETPRPTVVWSSIRSRPSSFH